MKFDDAFDRLISHEGGYVNEPSDPGGETKFGISKRSYPRVDIAALTREQAREIYLRDFWLRINADKMYDGVAFQAFDFAVNSGIETAVRYLQKAVNVADDGYWGPVTSAAIASMTESDVIMRLLGLRLEYMTKLKNWPNASRGWARRIAQNLMFGAVDS